MGAGEGLGPEHRIRRKADFERTYADGVRLSGRLVALVGRRNERDSGRLGLAIPRRIGSAPVRNQLRRRLREVFRREAELRSRPIDVVVSPRAGAAEAQFAQLRSDFCRTWRRLCERVLPS